MCWKSSSKYIPIGSVVKAHGIKGVLLIRYYADSTDLLLRSTVFLGREDATDLAEVRVLSIKETPRGVYIAFDGVETRTQAELMRGKDLYILRESLPELPEGNFYRIALLGFSVYAHGVYVGMLESIQDVPLQELWYIRTPEGERVLFPAVEEYIDTVDESATAIYILPPEGLFDVCRT